MPAQIDSWQVTAVTIFEVCTSIFPLLSLTLTLVALPHPVSTTSCNDVLVVFLPSPGPRFLALPRSPGPCLPQLPPTSCKLVGGPWPSPVSTTNVTVHWWFFLPSPGPRLLTLPHSCSGSFGVLPLPMLKA